MKAAVVLFPTDTVVGLGCRFDSEAAISRIRRIKGIDEKNPLAVLISDEKQLDTLKVRRSHLSNLLIGRFWPGGLTFVLSSELSFPCSGEGNTLGLRMPDADYLRKIIDMIGVPIAATSANLHGQPAPGSLRDVDLQISKEADHMIDVKITSSGIPSTVVKIEGGLLRIIREGAVTSDEINAVVGARA
jgi:L-threonylcarbamoyladenylate synthase